jgi:hypothetical protein
MAGLESHMAVGIDNQVVGFICLLMALPALVIAALLGAASWYSALRVELDGTSKVFARGFLALAAVAAGSIGIVLGTLGVLMMLDTKSRVAGPAFVASIAICVLLLSAEFVIAGSLYRKVRNKTRKTWPAVLSWGSYAFGGLLSLSALGLLSLLAVGIGSDASGKPRVSAEVRRYRKGCSTGKNGSDCNMLGLRHRTGSGGAKKDETQAAIAFQRSCDFECAAGCRNLARAYETGAGVPKDRARAELYRRRADTLPKP